MVAGVNKYHAANVQGQSTVSCNKANYQEPLDGQGFEHKFAFGRGDSHGSVVGRGQLPKTTKAVLASDESIDLSIELLDVTTLEHVTLYAGTWPRTSCSFQVLGRVILQLE